MKQKPHTLDSIDPRIPGLESGERKNRQDLMAHDEM